MNPILLALLLAQGAKIPPPPLELEQLKWLIGSWTCRIQRHDPELTVVNRFNFFLDLDGYVVTLTGENLEGMPGEKTIAHIVWDEEQKAFVQYRITKRYHAIQTRRAIDADHWDWVGPKNITHGARKGDREFSLRMENKADKRVFEEGTCTKN